MQASMDLDEEQQSASYQGSRLFQAVDNIKAAHETQRANAIATLVYDALRAAVDVHLNVSGFKITGKDQHQLSVEYAHAAMKVIVNAGDLEIYDELRLVRNRVVEYPPIGNFHPPATEDAIRYRASADRFVAAVNEWWNSKRRGT